MLLYLRLTEETNTHHSENLDQIGQISCSDVYLKGVWGFSVLSHLPENINTFLGFGELLK